MHEYDYLDRSNLLTYFDEMRYIKNSQAETKLPVVYPRRRGKLDETKSPDKPRIQNSDNNSIHSIYKDTTRRAFKVKRISPEVCQAYISTYSETFQLAAGCWILA